MIKKIASLLCISWCEQKFSTDDVSLTTLGGDVKHLHYTLEKISDLVWMNGA
jgi:hypothetical protein